MSNLADNLVRDVLHRLKLAYESQPKVEVEAFPGDPADWNLRSPQGAVLVRYAGSTFPESAQDGFAAQERASVEVSVCARELRSEFGIYSHIALVRGALQGQRLQGGTPLVITEISQGDYVGFWRYGLTFETTVLAVATADALDGGIFSQFGLSAA